jgi:hypothetical protein
LLIESKESKGNLIHLNVGEGGVKWDAGQMEQREEVVKKLKLFLNYKKITSNYNECIIMMAKVWVVWVEKLRFY